MATPGQGRVERRLVAILAVDVAGYSRLTGLDEEGTHAQLQDHLRSLVDPKIAECRGRVVKNTGDGLLAEFSSVVDAVRCAVDVQRGMAERNADVPEERRIEFRMGVNVGDIIIDGGDIFGDGVNVAARLEGLAEPGGICVSSRVQEDADGKLEVTFENAGEQQLKNITRPVRVYRVRLSGATAITRPSLPLPDKPSIAVLPFQNMSGDPEQEYFADGIVEEIITALSHFRQLFVIARNSSFTYKGRSVDVKQVGCELGVRYVLEGSVRKAANRVRIAGQLIDAATGTHLWADRFDGELENIFDLQDKVTEKVVGAIAPKLEQAEIERAKRKPTQSLHAYDYYLRGRAIIPHVTENVTSEALTLFSKAIDLDPDFASAYAWAAYCYFWRKVNGYSGDRAREKAETAQLVKRAAELGRDDADTLAQAGFALAYVVGDLDGAAVMLDRALTLNQNSVTVWHNSGWINLWCGEPETALKHLANAMRLSPLDPFLFGMQHGIAFTHFFAGRYAEAASWAERASREAPPSFLGPIALLAASHALAGQMGKAQEAAALLLQRAPTLHVGSVTALRDRFRFRRPEDLARYAEGLRKAGLPE
jgi:TolB-like protein/Tfp pilus assembly protein PilF